jgi:hypothetical protein
MLRKTVQITGVGGMYFYERTREEPNRRADGSDATI